MKEFNNLKTYEEYSGSDSKLEIEAKEKFPHLIKKIKSSLRNADMGDTFEIRTPDFFTESSDGRNEILLKMVEDEMKGSGFFVKTTIDGCHISY